jgi:transcription antitermination factor NusG
MDSGEALYPGGYAPGDMVTVLDGMFRGMFGVVIGPDQVHLFRRPSGDEPPTEPCPTGGVWVVLTIFGKTVPVLFLPAQIEHRPV